MDKQLFRTSLALKVAFYPPRRSLALIADDRLMQS